VKSITIQKREWTFSDNFIKEDTDKPKRSLKNSLEVSFLWEKKRNSCVAPLQRRKWILLLEI